MPKTIVITGATSCMGLTMTTYLLEQGHTVYAIVRKGSSKENFLYNHIPLGLHHNVHILHCDFENYNVLPYVIEKADIFINFSWVGTLRHERSQPETQSRNIANALKALKAAAEMGCKVFAEAGSQAEYGWTEGLITEETPCNPVTEYGKAKHTTWEEGAQLAKELGISYAHLRIFCVFGEGKTNDMIYESVKKIHDREPLDFTEGTQSWNMMSDVDAAKMISRLLLAVSERDGQTIEIYNIASPDTRPLREFITEMCEALHSEQSPNFGAVKVDRLLSLNPSIDKVMGVIGDMQFIPFREAIIQYYKNIYKNEQ